MRVHNSATTVRRLLLRLASKLRVSLYSDQGLTVVEILVVVVIIAIAATIAVPMLGSTAGLQVRSASNMIAADLEYAKSISIARGQNFSVVFDENAENYRIQDQSSTTIAHPVKKGFDYITDFTSGQLNRVDIVSADFDPGSNTTVTFDYLGSPYSGTGIEPLNSGQIIIQVDNTTATIHIEPVTGFISITD